MFDTAPLSDWDMIYLMVFLGFFLLGKPEKWVAAVMAVNFLGSDVLGGNLFLIGILDVACIIALMLRSRTANIVAALYVVMLPVYVASVYFSWPLDTTGGILELIGFAQILVMSNVMGGMGGRRRATDRRGIGAFGYSGRGHVPSANYHAENLARNTARHSENRG